MIIQNQVKNMSTFLNGFTYKMDVIGGSLKSSDYYVAQAHEL